MIKENSIFEHLEDDGFLKTNINPCLIKKHKNAG
jgi:hypothetical protein